MAVTLDRLMEAMPPRMRDTLKDMQTAIEKEGRSVRDCHTKVGKLAQRRQQLTAQKTENDVVSSELALLQDGDDVYKLVGPVLAKQDHAQAVELVKRRLEHIGRQIKSCEAEIEAEQKAAVAAREKVADIEKKAQELIQKFIQHLSPEQRAALAAKP